MIHIFINTTIFTIFKMNRNIIVSIDIIINLSFYQSLNGLIALCNRFIDSELLPIA